MKSAGVLGEYFLELDLEVFHYDRFMKPNHLNDDISTPYEKKRDLIKRHPCNMIISVFMKILVLFCVCRYKCPKLFFFWAREKEPRGKCEIAR